MTFSPRYRALVYASLVASFLVVVWGGVVRVTGSGLGCPDWPTCHGQFLPSLDPATQIEWFHRFLGIAGGLALAALGVATVVGHRANRRVLALVIAAGVLYIFQAVIGAIVVILELPQTWVTAHLANAELILAVLTTLAVGVRWPSTIAARDRAAPRGRGGDVRPHAHRRVRPRRRRDNGVHDVAALRRWLAPGVRRGGRAYGAPLGRGDRRRRRA